MNFCTLQHIKLNTSKGFTLLEMILVLFLISMMASSILFLTENVEDQAKYDETKRRMEIIREAIVGDSTRTLNGETELRGFAMDMGRLPECMRELLTPLDCNGNDLAIWQFDDAHSIDYGWNGPYLQSLPELDGTNHFRDGYSNQDINQAIDDRNSGWLSFNSISGLGPLSIQSDNVNASSTSDDITVNELVSHSDYIVTLASHWQQMNVELDLPYDSDFLIAANDLRLRFNYPINGALPSFSTDADERDLTAGLSERFPTMDIDYVNSTNILTFSVVLSDSIEISPPAILSGGNTLEITSDTTLRYINTSTNSSVTLQIDSSCGSTCITGLSNLVETNGTVNTLTFTGPDDHELLLLHLIGNPVINTENLFNPTVLLPSDSSLSGTTVTLPNGAQITLPSDNIIVDDRIVTFAEDDDSNGIYDTDADITISESFTLSGNLITTDTTLDSFYVPAGTQISGNDLTIPSRLPISFGELSFTVICDSNNDVFNTFVGVSPGVCGNNPDIQTSSYSFKYVPRAIPPSKPEPLIWTIQ